MSSRRKDNEFNLNLTIEDAALVVDYLEVALSGQLGTPGETAEDRRVDHIAKRISKLADSKERRMSREQLSEYLSNDDGQTTLHTTGT